MLIQRMYWLTAYMIEFTKRTVHSNSFFYCSFFYLFECLFMMYTNKVESKEPIKRATIFKQGERLQYCIYINSHLKKTKWGCPIKILSKKAT